MGLVVTSRKFFYENKNDTDFATDTGDFTNFLRGSVGELCKVVYDFTITNFVSVTPVIGSSFIITLVSGTTFTIQIVSDTSGVEWGNYKDGFVFDMFDNDTSALKITDGTVISISGSILTFTSSTVVEGTFTDADAKTTQEWTDFNFFYRNFGNDFNSPIDGSPQKFHADLGSPQSVSLVTGDALGSGAWQNGSFKIKFVSDSDGGAVQLFVFEHIFEILPYFDSGQIADITNLNTVIPYIDGDIKYDFQLEAYNIANVTSVFSNSVFQTGQVTWYNSAKSSLPTSYSLTSITYTDTVTSKTLTKLTTENKVHVVVVIADDGAAPFITADPFTVKHSLLLEDFADNTTQLYDEIWLNENKRNTLDTAANSGTIITDLTGVRDSAVQITIEFDIELTAPQKLQVQDGFNYILLVYLEDSTKTNLTTNETPLILDVNNYTVNSDIDGIISETNTVFYKHINDIGGFGSTDYDGTIEDGVVGVIKFTIDPSVNEVILNNLAFIIVAYDTVNDVWFEIQRNDIGIVQNIFVTDPGTGKKLQQIELNTTRGFNLKAGNQFNFKKITTGAFSNPSQAYTFTYGFKINWEAFEALQSASTDFYDPTKENNGLNLRTSNYSGVLNRQIRFGREYIYTVDGVKTTKVIFSPDSDINNYGDSDDNWSVIIKTENDAAFDLEEKFQNRQDTTIVATFTDTTTLTDADEFEAVIIAKEKNSSDFFEISTQRDVLAGGILKPITGNTASKSIVSGDLEVRCKMDFTKIANPNYSVSARIFRVGLFNVFSMLFDGTDEYFNAGTVSSFNFIQNTGIFTISVWMKFTDFTIATNAFFMGNNNGVASAKGFQFGWLHTNDTIQLRLTKGLGGNDIINSQTTTNAISDNNWHHIVVRGDGTNIFFNIDNVKQTGSDTMDVTKSTGDSSRSLNIGRINTLTGANWNGNQDEVSIWDDELSDLDVSIIYNFGCPNDLNSHPAAAASLVSWWRMGEGATFGGGNWTVPDEKGSSIAVSVAMEEEDRVMDTIC